MWESEPKLSKEKWFEQYCASVINSETPTLPPETQKVGKSIVVWEEIDPGVAWIRSRIGTASQRSFAEWVVKQQLEAAGYKRAQFTFDHEKIAGETMAQRLRRAQELEVRLGPDTSKTVHEFPDGWSVKQLQTFADAQREGHLMNNCFAHDTSEYPNDVWNVHPQREADEGDMELDASPEELYGVTDYSHPLPRPLYSLRNQNNLPHVSIDPISRPEALGRHNEDPSINYKPYLQEWGLSSSADSNFKSRVKAWDTDPVEWKSSFRTANWDEIMEKAKRLMDGGNVQVIRNGANNIVGHVQGDHGDYDTEISRDDPNSRAITGWQCQCKWDQYAFQRTRRWKQLEARPCSHTLALYWKAQSMPLDDEFDPTTGQPMGQPQQAPQAPPTMAPGDPGTATSGPPQPPGQIPGQPAPDVLPPFPQAPKPPPPVSIPGGKQPSPLNPIQYPGVPGVSGTFSSVNDLWYNEKDAKGREINTAEGSNVETWNFAKLADVNQSSIQWHGEPQYRADHSFYYDTHKNVVHLGDSDYHHHDIMQEIPDFEDGRYWPGAIYDGGLEHYHDDQNPRWAPADNALINLDRQEGEGDLEKKIDGVNWNFSKQADVNQDLMNDRSQWGNLQVRLNQATYGIMQGKALILDTLIPTPDGWTTMKEISSGDKIFDELGNVQNVIATSDIWQNRPVYRVYFDDGSSIDADANHEWVVTTFAYRKASSRSTNIRLPKTHRLTTISLMENLRYREQYNYTINNSSPLNLSEVHLPIDPYVLGYWLGDGSSYGGKFTTADSEISSYFEDAGFKVTKYKPDYEYGTRGLETLLRQNNLLKNKHIPSIYLRGSISQRYELLKGLMDSDGYVSEKGDCEFCSTKEHISLTVSELLASLGIKNRICKDPAKLNGVQHGWKWRIRFSTDLPVFRLPRKLIRQKLKLTNQNRRSIIKIEFCNYLPTKCITTSAPSGLFLAGSMMIPTHNSEAHGAGQYKEIPANSIGTLMEVDPSTGWCSVIFAGPQSNAGPMQPYHVSAWLEPKELTVMQSVQPPGPFVRRRNPVG